MGLVNTVVPLDELEAETVAWCREMLALSPFALRLVKASFNAHEDGYAGIQQLAHDANLLFYGSEEAAEGREAFKQKRSPGLLQVPAAAMRIWVMAARPRTLPAAIAPVLVGTAAAVEWVGEPAALRRLLRRPGRLDLHPDRDQPGQRLLRRQRGADTADRLGPVRVTSAGLVTPQRVLSATWIAFAVAVACGIYLAAVAGHRDPVIGALSIAAGVLYTGGPRPYGYAGLGEVFVFLFFGLVAVNGSYYVQLEQLDALPLGLSISIGFLATAILVVNNVRDIETDRRAGKMTLAVRMGAPERGRPLPSAGARRLRRPAARTARREASWLPLIGLLAAAAGDQPDAGDDQPHRRPRPERRPRRDRGPARRLQPAGLGRPADSRS